MVLNVFIFPNITLKKMSITRFQTYFSKTITNEWFFFPFLPYSIYYVISHLDFWRMKFKLCIYYFSWTNWSFLKFPLSTYLHSQWIGRSTPILLRMHLELWIWDVGTLQHFIITHSKELNFGPLWAEHYKSKMKNWNWFPFLGNGWYYVFNDWKWHSHLMNDSTMQCLTTY